ncbi:MAG: alpha-2-macroglobulin family protein, partial [Anaerolineae bacterium]
KIHVSGLDEAENRITSSAFIWVSGKGYVNWGQQNNNRIDLVADKKGYQVGEVARILVPSPFQIPCKALLTIERGQVIEKRVIDLSGTSQIVEIPILAEYAPNVYISIFIVQGTDADNPEPGFRLGYVMLPVAPTHKKLAITITPHSQGPFKPRDVVTYDITVRSDQGLGVQAELSLDLVDEAIWALTGGDSRDIYGAFYEQRGLGVQTAATLSVLPARQKDLAPSEAKGGSGGISDAGFVRGAFKDTALWLPTLLTDAKGNATISVTLPDNLTTWRLTAQGITAESAVGKAHNSVISRLDLMVRPIIPRFLVIGDEPVVSCSIQNSTDQTLDLTVSLFTEGISISQSEQQVQVPARSQAVVSWNAKVNEGSSQAKVQFRAAGSGYQDSVEITLPVYHPSSPEVVGTAGEVEQTTVELIQLPKGIDPSLGNLSIQVDPSLAAGMGAGLEYLKTYPYDCIEQTISRFLPNLATFLAKQQLGLSQDDLTAQLPQEITIALQRIYAQQNPDGGWGWWQGERSDPVLTAYALQGLSLIKQAGFTVDSGVWRRCLDYLKQWLSQMHPDTRELHNQQASVLYALAEAGQGDLGRTVRLYEYRGDMALYAQAYLALALQILNPAEQTRPLALVDNLKAKAVLSAGGASWQEERLDAWGLSSDTRSTAIILRALVHLQPGSSLGANVVRWLMTARVDGRWKSTQETAWAILALTDYMVASGELNAEYDYQLTLGQDILAQGNVTPASITESFNTSIPVSDLQVGTTPLVIERSQGPGKLYYSAYLRYYLPAAKLQALNRGLIVQRQYTMADKPGEIATKGKINDLITIKLTLIVPHDVYYLILEDFIPAGCEVVDTSLRTTRQLQQDQYGFTVDEVPFQTGYAGLDRWIWGWPWATHTEIRDNKVVLFANALTRGTYEYTYQVRCTTPGLFQVMPAIAYEMYQPDRFGRSEGFTFNIAP